MAEVSLKEIIKEQYKRCALDQIYFFKKYCFIQHPIRGKILFNLFPFQEFTLREIVSNDFNIILKSRQMGISTLTAGIALWTMLFQSDKNILVIATKQEVAKNLVTKVRTMYQNLPQWLKLTVLEDNKLSLRLSNGSQIKAVSSSGDAGRSEALSLLIVDEAAFIPNINVIWGGIYPTLSTGGKAIVLSTPNGVGNWFHKQWVKAEAGGSDALGKEKRFHPITLHWTLHPERDQSWRDKQDAILGPKLAAQECDCSFESSGNTIVEPQLLKWYRNSKVKEPIEKRLLSKEYWLWEYPDYNRKYIVCADVARGDGTDFDAFHVLDAETLVQCAEYKGLMSTTEFGKFLVAVATEWNNALLIIENNSYGWAVIQTVIDSNYSNLFYSTSDLKYVDVEHQMSNKIYGDEKKMVPGFTNSMKTRPIIINKLDLFIRQKQVELRSSRTLDELDVFIWLNGKAQAMSGYNDDLILSLAFGVWVRETALKLLSETIEKTKQTINLFKVKTYENVYTNPMNITDPYKMNLNKNSVTPNYGGYSEDLRWLINPNALMPKQNNEGENG